MTEAMKSVSLGDVSTVITSGSRGWAKYYASDGSPFIRMTNLRRDGIALDLEDLRYVSLPENSVEAKRTKLKKDDILVSITAELGKTGFVRNVFDGDAFISQHVCLIRIESPEIDNEYAAYLLSSEPERRRLNRLNDAGAKAGLNLQTIAKYRLTFPPLPEQSKIAEILRTWDEGIEKLEVLIDRVKRRHLAITHSLILGSRRLLRFKKSDDFTAHHWFALPKEWNCQPIGKLAIEVSERNGNREAFEVLSCSKYEGFVRSLEYFKKQVFSSDLTGYKKIWRGDFGFPSNHVEEGSIGLQDLVDVAVVSPIYTVFRFIPEKIDKAFAFSALKTSLYRHIFEVSTSASVDRRGSLRWKEFAKIPFPVPPRSEQEAISEVLAVHSRKLTALEEQRDMYVRQKRGLMQKLLTGEWQVKVEEN